jgi:hypothetical protein
MQSPPASMGSTLRLAQINLLLNQLGEAQPLG